MEGSEGQHCIDLAASAYTPPPPPHTHTTEIHSIITSSAVPTRPAPRPLFRAFQSSADFLDTIPYWNGSYCGTKTALTSKTRLCGFFKPVCKLLRWLCTNVYGVRFTFVKEFLRFWKSFSFDNKRLKCSWQEHSKTIQPCLKENRGFFIIGRRHARGLYGCDVLFFENRKRSTRQEVIYHARVDRFNGSFKYLKSEYSTW